MRNFTSLLVALPLLVNQAWAVINPTAQAASDPALEAIDVVIKSPIELNTGTIQAVSYQTERPDFNTQITKLRAWQEQQTKLEAARARQAALRAQQLARLAAQRTKPVVVAGSDVWAQLRYCEAGGIYNRNSGNGYYGAYQFDLSTWGGWGGYARADLAPPAVQDAKARETQARRGWYPWPACARKLGLI
jgi:hypothetical protein